MARVFKVLLTVVLVVGMGIVSLAAQAKLAAPIRGDAEIGFLTPVTTVDYKANLVRTVIKVKNTSLTGSIAGLKVEEFWLRQGRQPGDGFQGPPHEAARAGRGGRAETRHAARPQDGPEQLHVHPREREDQAEAVEGALAGFF